MGDQDENAGDERDRQRGDGDSIFAGGEFFEIEMPNGEECDQGDGNVKQVFCAAIGPVPSDLFGDIHGRRLDHEDSQAKQAQDADGQDVLETETVDGGVEHPQAVIGREGDFALIFALRI